MTGKLFMIAHTNDDGDSFDLFVQADEPVEAVQHWLAYYEIEPDEDACNESVRVFEIPPLDPNRSGPLDWDTIPQVKINPCTMEVER